MIFQLIKMKELCCRNLISVLLICILEMVVNDVNLAKEAGIYISDLSVLE